MNTSDIKDDDTPSTSTIFLTHIVGANSLHLFVFCQSKYLYYIFKIKEVAKSRMPFIANLVLEEIDKIESSLHAFPPIIKKYSFK